MKVPKALMVHADGTTEPLSADDACGLFIFRKTTCPCGNVLTTRKYRSHYASTSTGKANEGTIVFIEEPA